MPVKSKITFAVPESLKNEVRMYVIKEGYGLRGKSKWVSEAVESLLSLKDYPELISYNDEMYGFNEIETIVLSGQLKLALEKAVLQVRTEYPTLEGVKSRIMRTAIMQRILRS
jgi:hypothetical protein